MKQPPEAPASTKPQPPPGLPSQVVAHPDNPNAPYLPNQDERTMAMLIHLLSLLTGFIGPLILWLIKRDQSRYIDFHGKECLNFNLSYLLYIAVCMGITIGVGLITFGLGVIFIMPLFFVIGIGFYILEILACVAAHNSQWHRIPLTIRFIR